MHRIEPLATIECVVQFSPSAVLSRPRRALIILARASRQRPFQGPNPLPASDLADVGEDPLIEILRPMYGSPVEP